MLQVNSCLRRKEERQGSHACLSRSKLGRSFANIWKHIFRVLLVQRSVEWFNESLVPWSEAVMHCLPPSHHFINHNICSSSMYSSQQLESRALANTGSESVSTVSMAKRLLMHQSSVSPELRLFIVCLTIHLSGILIAYAKLYPHVNGFDPVLADVQRYYPSLYCYAFIISMITKLANCIVF